MNRIRRLAIATTIATYVLISVGGFVRAAGAGLGCPDWPMCFGRFIPPTSADQLPDDIPAEKFNFAKAWIEYGNRLVGVVIGLLILACVVTAFRNTRRRDIRVPAIIALVLVGLNGWLGGKVVESELDPRLVTVHLFLAMALVAALLVVTWSAARERLTWQRPASGTVRLLDRLTVIGLAVLFVQVLLGALVRGELEIVSADESIERAAWLEHVGWVDLLHRETAILVAVLALWACRAARRLPSPESFLKRLTTFHLAVIVLQIVAGIGLAYGGLPPGLQLAHLTLGMWSFGTLFTTLLALRCPPTVE